MSYTIGVGCGPCSKNDETDGDCLCVDCVKGGYQCLPNNPSERTAQMMVNIGKRRDIALSRPDNYRELREQNSYRSFDGRSGCGLWMCVE